LTALSSYAIIKSPTVSPS